MPHFDDVAQRAAIGFAREQGQEIAKARLVKAQKRGELPQDRAKLAPQFEHSAIEEALDRRAGGRRDRDGGSQTAVL